MSKKIGVGRQTPKKQTKKPEAFWNMSLTGVAGAPGSDSDIECKY